MSFQLSPLFGDGMVFPAGKTVRVFGSGDFHGVCVRLNGHAADAVGAPPSACEDITWIAELPPMPYGGPYVLTVSGPDRTVCFHDVFVGEVVLVAGQSNMQFKMKQTHIEKAEEIRSEPLLRLFTPDRIEDSDKYHARDGWIVCEKDDVAEWSAVGWYTGMNLCRTLGCAVGLVACYQGASVIESWIPAGECDDLYVPLSERYKDHTHEYYGQWNADGTLYRAMIRPLLPFALSAVAWYQGESDTTVAEAAVYDRELTVLIRRLRSDFLDPELPFAVVQIADYDHRPDAGWTGVQEAQKKVTETVPGTALVVSRDVCESNEIHPVTKSRLSERLAQTIVLLLKKDGAVRKKSKTE